MRRIVNSWHNVSLGLAVFAGLLALFAEDTVQRILLASIAILFLHFFDEVELQQPELNVRQLGLSGACVRLGVDFARRALFAVGGDDFLAVGVGNAFDFVQREATDALQPRHGDGRVHARAAVDLLFRERLRRQFFRLE